MTEPPRPALVVRDLVVRFGGTLAVNGLSLHAPGGDIVGLIGPNGAGKTTTFNACSGAVTPDSGDIRLGETALSSMSPARRARAGLGRTFQRMELVGSMTVRENVAMGPDALQAGRRPWSQVVRNRRDRAEVEDRTEQALRRCGILELADRRAGELPTGQRRLVEIARASACSFRFLLLDEPSSGLDVDETAQFAEILLALCQTGTGILLVEHDMALVRRVCSYLYVLDFGELVFDGPAAAALESPIVRAAYLGREAAV